MYSAAPVINFQNIGKVADHPFSATNHYSLTKSGLTDIITKNQLQALTNSSIVWNRARSQAIDVSKWWTHALLQTASKILLYSIAPSLTSTIFPLVTSTTVDGV